MNARQIEIFRAIMREGSLTAAANSLFVSQPAVSKVLSHFETQLGYRLFERINGRLTPTAEAHLLYEDADRVFREIEVLKEYARKIGEKNIGLLRIGASFPITFSVLPRTLGIFFRNYPDVKVQLHSHPKREVVEQLLLGDIDLALTMTTIIAPTVKTEILATEQMVVVMEKTDPLSVLSEVTATDLIDRPLISYGSHADVGPAMDEAFAAAGHRRSVRIEISSAIAAAPLVRSGLGIGLVGGLVNWSAFQGLTARPFSPRITMNLSISRNSSRTNSRFYKPFLQAIHETLLTQEVTPPT